MRTAVCTVMCSEPMIFAPASGCLPLYSLAKRHQAGHLVLGEPNLFPSEIGEGDVGDFEGSRSGPTPNVPAEPSSKSYGISATLVTIFSSVPMVDRSSFIML